MDSRAAPSRPCGRRRDAAGRGSGAAAAATRPPPARLRHAAAAGPVPPAAPAAARRLPPAAALLLLALPLLLPQPAAAAFYTRQGIGREGASFCGWTSLRRYTLWCQGPNVSAWVASETSCVQYGVCVPLEGAETMACSTGTALTCSGRSTAAGLWRSSGGGGGGVACLVVQVAAREAGGAGGANATCDVSIEGASVADAPPPPSPPGLGSGSRPGWALWKTMAIIWSILGAAALLVVCVLAATCMARRSTAVARTAPVTSLTRLEAQHAWLTTQQPLPYSTQTIPYGTDMTVTVRPVAPDGKPILAYGSTYPASIPIEAIATGGTYPYGRRQLPPPAGDTLLRAAAASREAYNGSPVRTAPVPYVPPPHGVSPRTPGVSSAGAGAATPASPYTPEASHAAGAGPASGVAIAGRVADEGAGAGLAPGTSLPLSSPMDPSDRAMGDAPFVVTPAALVPPVAATLKNGTASLHMDVTLR